MHRTRNNFSDLPYRVIVALLLVSVSSGIAFSENTPTVAEAPVDTPTIDAPTPPGLQSAGAVNPDPVYQYKQFQPSAGHAAKKRGHKGTAVNKKQANLKVTPKSGSLASVNAVKGSATPAVKAPAKKTNPLARYMRPFVAQFSLPNLTLGHPTPLLGKYAPRPETATALLPRYNKASHTRSWPLVKSVHPALTAVDEQPIPQLQGNLLPKHPEDVSLPVPVQAPLKRLAAALRPEGESHPVQDAASPEPAVTTSQSSFASKTNPTTAITTKGTPLNDLPETEGNNGIPLDQVAEHQAENRPITASNLLRVLGGLVIVLGLIAVAFKMRWFNWSGLGKKDGDLTAAQIQQKQKQKKQFMRRLSIPAQHPEHPFEVLATTPLGENKEIHLVQVKNRYLVLGTSISENIQVLTEFNEPAEEDPGAKEDSTEALLRGLPQFVATHQAESYAVQAWHDEEKTQPITVIEEPAATVNLDPERVIYQGELHAEEEHTAPKSPKPVPVAAQSHEETSEGASVNAKVFQDLAKRYAALASASALSVHAKNDFEPRKDSDEKAAARIPVAASPASSDTMTGVKILSDYDDDENS